MNDREPRDFWRELFRPGTPACAVLCGILAVAVALMMLTLGFWKTLLLVAFFAVGWWIGAVKDKAGFFRHLFSRIFPDRNP